VNCGPIPGRPFVHDIWMGDVGVPYPKTSDGSILFPGDIF